jgi:alanine racemase
MVRPGVSLYGMSPYAPAPSPNPAIGRLRPALRIETEIASVKTLPDGASVGYNRRYRCEGERRIAVIPIGYGDGFRRTPHNAGEVLVRGQRAPILGTVCMDQCMLDVTHIADAAPGDAVVVLGAQGDDVITADTIAERLGTINYEVTTALLARPAREYIAESSTEVVDA